MITDHDRSYYIGASDTKFVMGNWNTATFRHWWDVKMGLDEDNYDNIYLRTGTMYEHKILDHMNCTDRDRQIIIGRLRVNLDGELYDSVVEVKTMKISTIIKSVQRTKNENKLLCENWWMPPKEYIQQTQVELFATQKDCGIIIGYGLIDDDYDAVARGGTLEIDKSRLWHCDVYRDDEWLDKEYLPRLWYLCRCLEEERMPCMEDL